MSTRSTGSHEYCFTFQQRPGTAVGQHSSGDQPMSDLDVAVVDVRIFWGPSTRSRSVSPQSSQGTAWQNGLVVVHRVLSRGPAGTSRQPLPIPQSPDGESGQDHSAAQRLMDAFDDYMAKALVGPTWQKANEVWVTPVCEDIAAVAERISGMRDQWHELVLGKPVQYLAGSTPLTDIAAEFALPGDEWFAGIKRLVEVSGIFFGLASGQPLLVNACFKMLVHDTIIKAVSDTIDNLLNNMMQPAGAFERDLESTRTRAELEQQARELQELIEIARDELKEREEAKYADLERPVQDRQLKIQEHKDRDTSQVSGWEDPPESETTETNQDSGQTRERNDHNEGRD